MFLSFILLLLCIIARHQRSNRRLCEKRNLTDLVKLIAAIAVVVCHLFTFYMPHGQQKVNLEAFPFLSSFFCQATD
jgi:hypothetical protein